MQPLSFIKPLKSTLEVERKFLPTALLQQYLSSSSSSPKSKSKSNSAAQAITLPRTTLTRQPRKLITDKYFDRASQLQRRGIWVRWRKTQPADDDNSSSSSASQSHGVWEAKIKQSGDYLASQFVEVQGREAVESVLSEAGVGESVFDLKFQMGFVAERASWGVEREEEGGEMTLVLDTITTALEGRDGDRPVYFFHQVGELELEAVVTTELGAEGGAIDSAGLIAKHRVDREVAGAKMSEELSAFMADRPEMFAGEGSPVGKLSAYLQYHEEKDARKWKANEGGRVANMSEERWEREYNGK